MRNRKVPEVVVRRLAIYLRVLNEVDAAGDRYISSQELGERAGVTAAQVRKDLAMFGEFGKQGVGYQAGFLRDEIARILHADRTINFAIIGAGELGTALARYTLRRYENERGYPFRLAAIFDIDENKIGQKVFSVPISHVNTLPQKVKEERIKMALLTVPASAAQETVDLAAKAGLKALLNFAPTKITAPPGMRVHNADVSLDLHQLAFFI